MECQTHRGHTEASRILLSKTYMKLTDPPPLFSHPLPPFALSTLLKPFAPSHPCQTAPCTPCTLLHHMPHRAMHHLAPYPCILVSNVPPLLLLLLHHALPAPCCIHITLPATYICTHTTCTYTYASHASPLSPTPFLLVMIHQPQA